MAVDYIENGEDVDAEVTNRPIGQLAQMIASLQANVDAFSNKSAVIDFGRPCSSSVVVGTPVAFDTALNRYVPAAFTYDVDSPSTLSAVADVRGVVLRKRSSTVADVALSGCIEITSAQAAAVGLTTAGVYRLSSSAGLYTAVGSGWEVVFWDGTSRLYLLLRDVSAAEAHAHYRFELSTHHVEDGGGPGWISVGTSGLPLGTPPEGAVYGYNLDEDSSLSSVWPPAPADQASLTLFPGGWLGFGRELPPGIFVVDATTIWWMTDAVGHRPWDLVEAVGGSSLNEGGSEPLPEAPAPKLILAYGRVRYATSPATVTSLVEADPDGPITVERCDGRPGNSGPLKIGFAPENQEKTTTEEGSVVVKRVVGADVYRGPVTEGLVAGSNAVTLNGTLQRLSDPEDEESDVIHQGIVEIQFNSEPGGLSLAPQVIKLNDVLQRPDLMTLGFPPGKQSSVRMKFVMPGSDRFPLDAVAVLQIWTTTNVSGNLPALTATRRRIPTPTGVDTLPTTDVTIGSPTPPAPSLTDGEYVQQMWGSFEVSADDVIIIEITRAGNTDGYTGEVGILKTVLIVTPDE